MKKEEKKTAPAAQKPTVETRRATSLPNESASVPQRAAGQITDGEAMSEIRSAFGDMADAFADYTVTLSPAERKRLTGAGVRNHGFIEVCYEKAQEVPDLLPSFLSLGRFTDDHTDFENKQVIYDMAKRFCEIADDTLLAASDVVYHDALAFYNSVKEAAKMKVPGARALFDELSPYFKSHGARRTGAGEPTEKQVERDVRSLLHGTKEGEVAVRNVKPTVSGGNREVIDEVETGRAPSLQITE